MDLLETIRQRRSARGFLNIQVDSGILEDVLRDACQRSVSHQHTTMGSYRGDRK